MKILRLVCCTMLWVTAHCQVTAQMHLGALAGISANSIRGTPRPLTNSVGPKAGIMAEVGLSKSIFLLTEFDFAQRGAMEKNIDWFTDSDGKKVKLIDKGRILLDYLELPLTLKILLSKGKRFEPFLLVGPEVSMAIGAKSVVSYRQIQNGELIQFRIDEYALEIGPDNAIFNRFEYGLQFGTGVDFLLPAGKLFLDVRYNLGLSNPYSSSSANNQRNRGVDISLGYLKRLENGEK